MSIRQAASLPTDKHSYVLAHTGLGEDELVASLKTEKR